MATPEPVSAERIDALLPQTQCRMCGHRGCRAYADALVNGEAGPDQCPPGGEEVARALAALLGTGYKPVDGRYGVTKPRALAVIDEALCIGCTLCIQACPVDAIVGAAKVMHTIIARDCTGCELCLAPCPVDCIEMVAAPILESPERRIAADRARMLFRRREARLQNAVTGAKTDAVGDTGLKQRTVARAIERARERLAKRP